MAVGCCIRYGLIGELSGSEGQLSKRVGLACTLRINFLLTWASSQIAKTLKSTLIRRRSYAKVWSDCNQGPFQGLCNLEYRGYPAKRALSAMRKHGGWGPFGRIPSICISIHLYKLTASFEVQIITTCAHVPLCIFSLPKCIIYHLSIVFQSTSLAISQLLLQWQEAVC